MGHPRDYGPAQAKASPMQNSQQDTERRAKPGGRLKARPHKIVAALLYYRSHGGIRHMQIHLERAHHFFPHAL